MKRMKTIILAGGLPSTLIEQDEKVPKPMAEIGGRPILWHIMKQYAFYGYNDFVICTGYKGSVIKDYFMNFYIYQSDITVDLMSNEIEVHRKQTEDWRVSIIDTGMDSSIIRRLLMASAYVGEEPALVVFGDCLSDIHINQLVKTHRASGSMATFAVAHPTGRNETLYIDEDGIYQGTKRIDEGAWVNACNMILEPEAFDCLKSSVENGIEGDLMECLARGGIVQAYCHDGFWSPVETIRDKTKLESLWVAGNAPWKVWESILMEGLNDKNENIYSCRNRD